MRRANGSIGRESGLSMMRRESGQGTLEYVLVLFLMVLIILGVVYQFNSSFRNYAQNYFGNYIACLLEVGELPGDASCSSEFQAFNGKSGKALVNGKFGNGGSTSQSSSNSAANANASKNAANAAAANKSSSPAGSSGEVSGSNGSGGSTFAGSLSGSPRAPATSVGVADKDQASSNVSDLVGISPTSTNMGRYHGERDRNHVDNLNWGYYGEEEERKKAEERPQTASVKKTTSDGNQNLRPRKAVETAKRTVAGASDDGDSGEFSFSHLIKWVLIILMILAIVIFFGGQMLQISKSGEK